MASFDKFDILMFYMSNNFRVENDRSFLFTFLFDFGIRKYYSRYHKFVDNKKKKTFVPYVCD